jgi:hypothetical protein
LREPSPACIPEAIFPGGSTPILIGYVRASKSDGSQTLEPQRDAVLASGVMPERIYQDLASGRHDARPGLTACLKALQPSNTLVLWKLDRLGRDLRHLVTTAENLRVRGLGLKVLAGAGAQIDTATANGRLAFVEFERERLHNPRQRADAGRCRMYQHQANRSGGANLLMTAPGGYRLDPAPSLMLSFPGSLVRCLHG